MASRHVRCVALLLATGTGSLVLFSSAAAIRYLVRRAKARQKLRELLAATVESVGDVRVVITGAGSGIGLELAQQLLKNECVELLLGNRDEDEREEERLRVLPLELLDFDSVQRFARESHRFLASGNKGTRLLINNAGVREPESSQTKFGVTRTWQINFLGPFLLTELIARFRETDRIRHPLCVINVASGRENESKLDDALLDNMAGRGETSSNEYADSKRALLLWTSVRAQSLAFKGNVFAHAVSPGKVDTRFGMYDIPGWLLLLSRPIRMWMYRTKAEAALSVAAAGLRRQGTTRFGQYLGEEQLLEDLVVWRMPEKKLAVQLVRWASQVTALEARGGGRPVNGLGKPLSVADLVVAKPKEEDRWSSAERRWSHEQRLAMEDDEPGAVEQRSSWISRASWLLRWLPSIR